LPQPWEDFVDEEGDWSADAIYVEVGRALTQWETLESELANIYAHLLADGFDARFLAAGSAFGEISGSKNRLDMLKRVIGVVFSSPPMEALVEIQTEISDLLKDVQNYAGRRNAIAHGVVIDLSVSNGLRANFLVPAWYLTRKQHAPSSFSPKFKFNSKTLASSTLRFIELRRRATDIHLKLLTHLMKRKPL